MKVEKKSELIGRGGVYRRPVGDTGSADYRMQALYLTLGD
jgi:hypothetical protein